MTPTKQARRPAPHLLDEMASEDRGYEPPNTGSKSTRIHTDKKEKKTKKQAAPHLFWPRKTGGYAAQKGPTGGRPRCYDVVTKRNKNSRKNDKFKFKCHPIHLPHQHKQGPETTDGGSLLSLITMTEELFNDNVLFFNDVLSEDGVKISFADAVKLMCHCHTRGLVNRGGKSRQKKGTEDE